MHQVDNKIKTEKNTKYLTNNSKKRWHLLFYFYSNRWLHHVCGLVVAWAPWWQTAVTHTLTHIASRTIKFKYTWLPLETNLNINIVCNLFAYINDCRLCHSFGQHDNGEDNVNDKRHTAHTITDPGVKGKGTESTAAAPSIQCNTQSSCNYLFNANAKNVSWIFILFENWIDANINIKWIKKKTQN